MLFFIWIQRSREEKYVQELAFILFVTDSLFAFVRLPTTHWTTWIFRSCQQLQPAWFFSRILVYTMTMNSLLYAVVVHELFSDMIILELFQKVWEVFMITPKPHQLKKPLKKPISYRSFCLDINICCLIDRFWNVYTWITIFLQSGIVSLQDTWIKFLGCDFRRVFSLQWLRTWFWKEQLWLSRERGYNTSIEFWINLWMFFNSVCVCEYKCECHLFSSWRFWRYKGPVCIMVVL